MSVPAGMIAMLARTHETELLLTIYAHDLEQHQLLAVWQTGVESRATVVANVNPDHDVALIAELCQDLTDLSSAAWDTYVRPASEAQDEQDLHRADAERAAFTNVQDMVRNPNLPDEAGMMLVSYINVTKAAHRVGRTVRRINDNTLTEQITAALALDLDSVEQAERGDLNGRAAGNDA